MIDAQVQRGTPDGAVEVRVLPLIELIYAAVAEERRWEDFAVALSDAFGGTALLIWLPIAWTVPNEISVEVLRRSRILRVGVPAQTPEETAWSFANSPWSIVELEFRDRFGWGHDAFPDADVAGTLFFERAMKPLGLPAEGPIAASIRDANGEIALGVVAFRRENGRAFTTDDLRLGDLLLPHLRRAVDLDLSIDRSGIRNRALDAIVDRLPDAVVLLDRTGRPVATNHAADRLFAVEDGLRLDPTGIHAAVAREEGVLRGMIAEAVARDPSGVPGKSGILGISRRSGRRDLAIVIVPLVSEPATPIEEECAVAVFVTDPEAGQVSTVDMIRSIYSLTLAEGELAKLIADGLSLEEISEIRGVKISTTRSQLKQVFAKTGTKRQSELVRLILYGVGSMDFTPREGPPLPDPEPESEGT